MLALRLQGHWGILLGAFLGAFIMGVLVTYLTRLVANRVGFVANQSDERWHTRRTALAGGVGIFLPYLVVALFIGGSLRLPLLLGGGAMFALGFVDDLVHLKPYAKLVAQLVVAALTAQFCHVLPWTPWVVVNQAVTIFWIVGIANALNLLDNMDGLAAGIACIGAIFQGLFFLAHGSPDGAAMCAAFSGAVLGFLIFNFNPASIFMGDAGSLFLGYTLAVLALYQNYGRSRGLLTVVSAPVLVLLIPIFDTTFVTITRIVRGSPVSKGGKDHTSHRLVTLGLSERRTVLVLWFIAIVGGLLSLTSRLGIPEVLWVGVPLLVVGLAFVGLHLARGDFEKGSAASEGALAKVVRRTAAFGYKRHMFEVLLDSGLAMVAMGAAFLLRFDGDIPVEVSRDMVRVFPTVIVAKVAMLYFNGAYSGIWRYASVRDIIRLASGCLYGSVASVIIITFWLRLGTLSRGALIIDGLLFAGFVTTSRASFRLLRAFLGGRPAEEGRRVVLWGAGDAGAIVARHFLENRSLGIIPVGFIDDDVAKAGRTLLGLRVYGEDGDVQKTLNELGAVEVMLTEPDIPSDRVNAVTAQLGPGRVRRMRIVMVEDADA